MNFETDTRQQPATVTEAAETMVGMRITNANKSSMVVSAP